MSTNKQKQAIAISWARQWCATGKPVISDKFFLPFNNQVVAGLKQQLADIGIVAWPLPKMGILNAGAILFNNNTSDLTVSSDGRIIAGALFNEAAQQLIVLPAVPVGQVIVKAAE
jgi:hypothetical protein